MFQQLLLTGLILASGAQYEKISPLVSDRTTDTQPSIVIGDRLYEVSHQDPKYPLKTKISPATVKQLSSFFVFLKVEKPRVIALRPILQPVAEEGDPLALYWLAKTYDLGEFGLGNQQEAQIALKYYIQAADRQMATVEYFLFNAYRYQFMGIVKDERKAIAYLERAKLHGDSQVKAEVALDYARFYSPTRDRDDFTFIPRSKPKMIAALRSAHALNPKDSTAADWLGSILYEEKRYKEALVVYQHSSHPSSYRAIAEMYETGKGTRRQIRKALQWYKRAAKEELSPSNIDNRFGGYPYHHSSSVANIYRLICQRRISQADAKPYFQKQEYQHYLQASLSHQKVAKSRKNPCIPLPGG
jgi:TPR repeat protein